MAPRSIPRQFINDEEGKPVAVVLPIEEYGLIEAILEAYCRQENKLKQMEAAAHDPLFLADLTETMDFIEIPRPQNLP